MVVQSDDSQDEEAVTLTSESAKVNCEAPAEYQAALTCLMLRDPP